MEVSARKLWEPCQCPAIIGGRYQCINVTPDAAKWIYRWTAPHGGYDDEYFWTEPGEVATPIKIVGYPPPRSGTFPRFTNAHKGREAGILFHE